MVLRMMLEIERRNARTAVAGVGDCPRIGVSGSTRRPDGLAGKSHDDRETARMDTSTEKDEQQADSLVPASTQASAEELEIARELVASARAR